MRRYATVSQSFFTVSKHNRHTVSAGHHTPVAVCLQSQKLQGKTSITRSGTLQARTEKACLDVLSRLDADLHLSAIQGHTHTTTLVD